ncbi:MAG: YwaF family protein [Acholeplasmataceae bacterium]|nr:YwaF family protein [Acholeplasmataceae bacterium]
MYTIYVGSLFDVAHITYMIISLAVTAILLILAKRHLKASLHKDFFLKFFALATFLLHVSIMWVDFFKNGSANAPTSVLFPIYFCNMSMYMLMLVAFWGDKKSKTFQSLAILTAYGGFFGAMISLFYPEYYLGASSMFEWGVLKSMISHSTMLVGAIWLLIGNYFPIRITNTIVYAVGLLFYGLVGIIVNQTFLYFGHGNPNAMYLDHAPLSDVPFLNAYTISLLMLLFIIIFALFYEIIYVKKNERSFQQFVFFK